MLYLIVNQQQFALTNGRHFSQSELPGLSVASDAGPVAVVNANPRHPTVLGLKNLSTASWQAVMPSGSVKFVESGRTVKLEAGAKIILGGYAAEIVNVLPGSLVRSQSHLQESSSHKMGSGLPQRIGQVDETYLSATEEITAGRHETSPIKLLLAVAVVVGFAFFFNFALHNKPGENRTEGVFAGKSRQ